MRLRGNEVCFLSAGADGQGASPRRSENTAKKGIKPLQSAVSLTSCQTIPVKALFWWRAEEEMFWECKEENVYREEGDTLNRSCALVVREGEIQVVMCWNDRNGGFWINDYLFGHVKSSLEESIWPK